MGKDDLDPAALTGESDFAVRVRELRAAHRAHPIPRYRSIVLHWMGRWLRRTNRARKAPLPEVQPGQVAISFAGHATVLIRYSDSAVLCDPMLGNWARGVKRAVAPGLSPDDLMNVQLILISHDHADHLHRPTLKQLPRSATVVVPPQTAQHVSDLGFARVIELRPGQGFQDHGVGLDTAEVHHGDKTAQSLSYVVRGSGPSVYFCGDSGYFRGFAEIGARYHPDIALLPIGGYAPLSFRDRHMSPLDALYALEDLGARVMIPIHHGAFALSYEHLNEPSRWLAELVSERGLDHFVVELAPGESRVFVPPRTAHLKRSNPASLEPSEPGSVGSSFLDHPAAPEPQQPLPEVPAYAHLQAMPQRRRSGGSMSAFIRAAERDTGSKRERVIDAESESVPDTGIVIDADRDGLSKPVVVPG
ncbi:MAG: MBL fold metallo-hydrolase [Proteobacteria bacterium]|nr:MBL fold metallo-hydrolase [Pseudomonadota bacterium]